MKTLNENMQVVPRNHFLASRENLLRHIRASPTLRFESLGFGGLNQALPRTVRWLGNTIPEIKHELVPQHWQSYSRGGLCFKVTKHQYSGVTIFWFLKLRPWVQLDLWRVFTTVGRVLWISPPPGGREWGESDKDCCLPTPHNRRPRQLSGVCRGNEEAPCICRLNFCLSPLCFVDWKKIAFSRGLATKQRPKPFRPSKGSRSWHRRYSKWRPSMTKLVGGRGRLEPGHSLTSQAHALLWNDIRNTCNLWLAEGSRC